MFDESLSKHSWFNLGGPAKVIFKPENLNELSKYLNISGNTKIKVVVIGEKNKFLFELKNKRKLNSGLVKDLRKYDFVRKMDRYNSIMMHFHNTKYGKLENILSTTIQT